MTIRLSTGLRNNLVGSLGFAATFTGGVIDIYTGNQPVTADSPVTGTLLGTVTIGSGAFTPGAPGNGLTFGSPLGGVVSKSGVWSFNGIAAGTAGWFRFRGNAADNGLASTTLPRVDGSVAASGADLNISNVAIAVGAPNTVDSFTWQQLAQ